MIAQWADEYVGIPYLARGRTRSGCDCWGLVRLVLEERFGVVVPRFDDYDEAGIGSRDIVDERFPLVDAVEIVNPESGDIVLMRLRGQPCHVGIVVGGGYMLHTLRAHEAALDRYTGPRWAHNVEGFYRVR